MARLVDTDLVNLEKSDSWENLGLAPPIGSICNVSNCKKGFSGIFT